MSLRVLLFLALVISCCSCKRKPSEHSFYYWKSSYNDDSVDTRKIEQLGIDHFYLHYFDVDWSEGMQMAVPKGELQYEYSAGSLVANAYTPVVYITNRTFERMSADWCDSLAQRVKFKIDAITKSVEQNYINQLINSYDVPYDTAYQRRIDSIRAEINARRKNAVQEIQIDCDWTAGTKDKYFRFLTKIKEMYPGKVISATVRLYPYKYYKKEGVPPVDKGMVMCYNLGGIKDARTKNSVFNEAELRKYISGSKYPLPLDIAFPVFGWYVWFRGDKYKGIVHDDDINVAALPHLFLTTREGACRFNKDTVIGQNYYREGDILRPEFPDERELQSSIKYVTDKIDNIGRISFYHWGSPSTLRYEKTIQNTFEHY